MNDRRHIVQEYISSPLLLDMLKFDLRVYVVVTSIDPLEVSSMLIIAITLWKYHLCHCYLFYIVAPKAHTLTVTCHY